MNKRCIACNSSLKFLGEVSGAKILRCRVCGLGVTGEGGEKETYSAYHRDLVYVSSGPQFRNIFQKRVAIVNIFIKRGTALEAGSSAGTFLSLLKEQGWEVVGVEPSKTATVVARRRGISTINKTFEEASIPSQNFDLVIFNHVLEHMDDPLVALKKANKVLKKDGFILVDVPNFASLTARLLGSGWRYILPKEHRWHFTPTSIMAILNRAGFKTLYWEAHSGVWGYANPRKEIIDSLRGGKKRFFWDMVTLVPAFILTKLKAGTGLTVVAQKITNNNEN